MTDRIATSLPGGGYIDHIVLGVPDTERAADELAGRFGIRPSVSDIEGDDYPTRSGSVGLRDEAFFELYGPNPTYTGPTNFFRDLLVGLPEARLLTFMVRVDDLPDAIRRLADADVTVLPMLDEWERTHAAAFRNAQFADHAFDPAVPRLIEWKHRAGMDDRFVQGVTLRRMIARTDDLARVHRLYELLGLDRAAEIHLEEGSPGLEVELDTPNGVVTIR